MTNINFDSNISPNNFDKNDKLIYFSQKTYFLKPK